MKNTFTTKVLINLLILVLYTGQMSFSQGVWEEVYSDSEEFIRDICFVPGEDGLWQTGWGITGYPESLIIKTTDGGDTWTEITQDFSPLLASISFANESTGFICTLKSGDEAPEGLIMKSTDGGFTWFEVYGDTESTFDKIVFKDNQTGFVSGYPSLYTIDGGVTWVPSILPEEYDLYWQIDYAGSNTYFGVQLGGDVGKTTDGGATWTDIYSTSPTMLGGVAFYDGLHGLIGGDLSLVEVTHDGGETWFSTTLGTGQRFGIALGAFNADIMYAGLDIEEIWMTTDGGENWELDTTIVGNTYREMVVTPFNVVYVGGNEIGGGGKVWRMDGGVPLIAAFETDEQETCAGSSIDFIDLSYYDVVSWDWTFEGGDPATSTEQNPTVTYNNGGFYDVSLTVTNSNGDSQTITQTDFIQVFEIPSQADTPAGEENICTSSLYTYTIPEIEYAQAYVWELLPAEAGDLTWEDNDATLETAEDFTGEFTIRVRAGNFCGDGEWSEYLNGTISLSPELFALQGGGFYCEGGEGVEITLDGSQVGVDYQLFLGGQTIGGIVAGTGEPISFGFQTEEGTYDALGFNENCEISMLEQIDVVILDLPTPEINGLAMVCDWSETTYETTENSGSTYIWEVSGGTVTDGDGTHMVTVEWGVSGSGTVSVTEEDANGCSAVTDLFEVFIDDCTGIENEFVSTGIEIYPNPAQSVVNLDFSARKGEKIEFLIYSSLGQLVMVKEDIALGDSQTKSIDISSLADGVYILKIKRENHLLGVQKFMRK